MLRMDSESGWPGDLRSRSARIALAICEDFSLSISKSRLYSQTKSATMRASWSNTAMFPEVM